MWTVDESFARDLFAGSASARRLWQGEKSRRWETSGFILLGDYALNTDDIIALRQLADIYARGADQKREDDYRRIFAEDAELIGPGFAYYGLEEVLKSIVALDQMFMKTMHWVHNQTVEIDGELAWGETCSTVEQRLHPPRDHELLCYAVRYQDKWRKTDGFWKFTRRELIFDWEEVRPVRNVGQVSPQS